MEHQLHVIQADPKHANIPQDALIRARQMSFFRSSQHQEKKHHTD
jgi:hypothetical protein|tara:strand:- start:885 stop:1019 length:135 start_codon:yes stop_codon:yes gene_type:complete